MFGLVGLVAVGAAGWYVWHAKGAVKPPAAAVRLAARSQPVIVATAKREAIPNDIAIIGSVQASDTVAVKSRVDGAIVKVHFREGDEVKAGDPLFTLDSRAIESQLAQAQANLLRDRTQLVNARRDLARFSELARKDFATRQQLDTATTNTGMLESTIKADEAAIDTLKVTESYTQIRSPISGRTGSINLTAGNTVKANDINPLVVINRIDPIRVIFAVPQKYFEMVRAQLAQGPVEIFAEIPHAKRPPLAGKIVFLDNAIDSLTGTFQVKALVDNPGGLLWPGMFVNVVVRLGTENNALAIPSAAIQSGQQGTYVYVVDGDMKARLQPVTVAREHGGQSVIESGIEPGERVVVEGQLRLTNGTKVEFRAAKGSDSRPPATTPTPPAQAVKG